MTVAALLNFVGAFISLEVAATVAGGIVDAGAIAALGVFVVYRMLRRFDERLVECEFRWAQVASRSMVALAQRTNDAQKTWASSRWR